MNSSLLREDDSDYVDSLEIFFDSSIPSRISKKQQQLEQLRQLQQVQNPVIQDEPTAKSEKPKDPEFVDSLKLFQSPFASNLASSSSSSSSLPGMQKKRRPSQHGHSHLRLQQNLDIPSVQVQIAESENNDRDKTKDRLKKTKKGSEVSDLIKLHREKKGYLPNHLNKTEHYHHPGSSEATSSSSRSSASSRLKKKGLSFEFEEQGDTIYEEMNEYYTYFECSEYEIGRLLFEKRFSLEDIGDNWKSCLESDQRFFIALLVDEVEQLNVANRRKASQILLYLCQGVYSENTDRVQQLAVMTQNCFFVHDAGGLSVFVKWLSYSARRVKTLPKAAGRHFCSDMRLFISLIYSLICLIGDYVRADLEYPIYENLLLREMLTNLILDYSKPEAQLYPIKNLLLLLWKTLALDFGTLPSKSEESNHEWETSPAATAARAESAAAASTTASAPVTTTTAAIATTTATTATTTSTTTTTTTTTAAVITATTTPITTAITTATTITTITATTTATPAATVTATTTATTAATVTTAAITPARISAAETETTPTVSILASKITELTTIITTTPAATTTATKAATAATTKATTTTPAIATATKIATGTGTASITASTSTSISTSTSALTTPLISTPTSGFTETSSASISTSAPASISISTSASTTTTISTLTATPLALSTPLTTPTVSTPITSGASSTATSTARTEAESTLKGAINLQTPKRKFKVKLMEKSQFFEQCENKNYKSYLINVEKGQKVTRESLFPKPVQEARKILQEKVHGGRPSNQSQNYLESKYKEDEAAEDKTFSSKKSRFIGPEKINAVQDYIKFLSPLLPRFVVLLLKLMMAAQPSSKSSGSVRILGVFSFVNDKHQHKAPPVSKGMDMLRHKEVITKATSAIFVLLLRHFKEHDMFHFHYLSERIAVDSGILLLLMILKNARAIIYTNNNIANLEFFTYTSNLPHSKSHSETHCMEDEDDSHTKPCWRNYFVVVNVLRTLHYVSKRNTPRLLILTEYRAPRILLSVLDIGNITIELFCLKIFKSLLPFVMKKWKSGRVKEPTFNKILSGISRHTDSRFGDDWTCEYADANTVDLDPKNFSTIFINDKSEISLNKNVKDHERYDLAYSQSVLHNDVKEFVIPSVQVEDVEHEQYTSWLESNDIFLFQNQ